MGKPFHSEKGLKFLAGRAVAEQEPNLPPRREPQQEHHHPREEEAS